MSLKEGCALKKSERRSALVQFLLENPFATDEQLADWFHVSVATIRLDRGTLRIPEVRERIRQMAAARDDSIRSLLQQEVVGTIVHLQLNRYAISVLRVAASHVFTRTGMMRGHFLFAQVNSLAVAVMDADIAVTAKTELRFHRPVHLGESLRARVDIVGRRANVAKLRVTTKSEDDVILDGSIWVATDPSLARAE